MLLSQGPVTRGIEQNNLRVKGVSYKRWGGLCYGVGDGCGCGREEACASTAGTSCRQGGSELDTGCGEIVLKGSRGSRDGNRSLLNHTDGALGAATSSVISTSKAQIRSFETSKYTPRLSRSPF